MRNLKKVLSLALALVMLLGMMVVGAGAVTLDDYSDKAGINENYLEAVDLLTAINVLSGSQGNFDPAGNLTREQAAKIVATLALGVDAAEALSTAVAPFSDVAANWWSAGYVAYCANMGIVSGIGGGKFAPAGQVTGYQFAKMLLGVLGYGVNDEYKGANWVLNVSRDAVTVGVSAGVQISDVPLTREQAAQMAYNTIKLPLVSYSSLIGTYTAYAWTGNGQGQTLLGNLAKNIFEIERDVTITDDFGYNYENWYRIRNRQVITGNYLTDQVLGTVTGGKEGAMYKSYSWNKTVDVIENGHPVRTITSANLRNSTNDVIGYNGTVWTLVDSHDEDGDPDVKDGKVDTIIVVTDYLAEVTKVNEAGANSNRSVEVKVYLPSSTVTTVTTTVETEDFAKGDYILIAPSMTLANVKVEDKADLEKAFGGSALRAEAAEVVSASTVTAYYKNTADKNGNMQTNGSVTTGGKKYSYNGVFTDKDALGYNFATDGQDLYTLNKATYNFYLDKAGNVIGVKVVEDAIKDLAYIIAVGEDAFKRDNIVSVLLSDGTVGTYNVSSQSGMNYSDSKGNVWPATDTTSGHKIYDSGNANNDCLDLEGRGHIYSYSFDAQNNIILNAVQNTNGNYLNAATTVNGKITAFTKGYSTISYTSGTSAVAFADENTIFAYYDNGRVSMYTGLSNAPSVTSGNSKPAAIVTRTVDNRAYAAMVVIEGTPEAALTNNYVYVVKKVVGYATDNNGSPVYYYDVVKDGKTTVIAAKEDGLTPGVYVYSFDANAFTSDDPNKVESGLYGLSTNGLKNNMQTNILVHTVSGGVIVGTVNGYQKLQYVIGTECSITDVSDGPAKTGVNVKAGDIITVVYSAQGVNNVARDVYITGAQGGGNQGGNQGGKPQDDNKATTTGITLYVEKQSTNAQKIEKAIQALQAAGFTDIVYNGTVTVGSATEFSFSAKLNGVTYPAIKTSTTYYAITDDVDDAKTALNDPDTKEVYFEGDLPAGATIQGGAPNAPKTVVITGNVTGALTVPANTNVTVGGVTAAVTGAGDVTVTGDVSRTGSVTSTGDITVTGDVAGTVTVNTGKDATITGNVTGTVNGAGDVAITGDVAGTATVSNTGDVTVTGSVGANATVSSQGAIKVAGDVAGTVTVSSGKEATITGAVNGTVDGAGNATVGSVTANGTVESTGNITVKGDVAGTVTAQPSKNLTIEGDIAADSTITMDVTTKLDVQGEWNDAIWVNKNGGAVDLNGEKALPTGAYYVSGLSWIGDAAPDTVVFVFKYDGSSKFTLSVENDSILEGSNVIDMAYDMAKLGLSWETNSPHSLSLQWNGKTEFDDEGYHWTAGQSYHWEITGEHGTMASGSFVAKSNNT